jgi:hypothetical protein
MNKKKEDKMYPASYVDLLETRVSVLLQTLSQLLAKSKEDLDGSSLISFCQDAQLLNSEGSFDMNKVICNLLSTEKLDNLAESNHDYTIDDITNITSEDHTSPQSNSVQTGSRSNSSLSSLIGSASPTHTHAHYSLSKAKQSADGHIHKSLSKKSHLHHSNVSSLSSSFQSNFTLGSPTFSSPASTLDMRNTSLDITSNNDSGNFKHGTVVKNEPIHLSLENVKEEVSHSDSVSSLTLSPVENSDSDLFPIDTFQSFDNENINDWRLTGKLDALSNLGFQSINNPYNQINHPADNRFAIKVESPDQLDPFSSFNMKFETIFD